MKFSLNISEKMPFVIVGSAIILLVVMAMQYTLSATVPIGRDSAAHVRNAQILLSEYPGRNQLVSLLRTNAYPLPIAVLALFKIIPISWPERFIWCITLSYIAVGLALGLLLHRLYGYRAAATGMAIWALHTTGFTGHFEDGSLPQLFSLLFLLLFFERFAERSPLGCMLALIGTVLSHPITGTVLLMTLAIITPALIFNKKYLHGYEYRLLYFLAIFLFVVIVTCTYLVITRGYFSNSWASNHLLLPYLIHARLLPWLVLSIPGWFLLNRLSRDVLSVSMINAFIFLTLLLALNNLYGADLWTSRFRSLFVLILAITSALALPSMVRMAFANKIARFAFVVLLFIALTFNAWQANAKFYAYELNTIARRDQMAAINWLTNNTDKNAKIVSFSPADRDPEWIPVISHRRWEPTSVQNPIWEMPPQNLHAILKKSGFNYLVIFARKDEIPISLLNNITDFPVMFSREQALILSIL